MLATTRLALASALLDHCGSASSASCDCDGLAGRWLLSSSGKEPREEEEGSALVREGRWSRPYQVGGTRGGGMGGDVWSGSNIWPTGRHNQKWCEVRADEDTSWKGQEHLKCLRLASDEPRPLMAGARSSCGQSSVLPPQGAGKREQRGESSTPAEEPRRAAGACVVAEALLDGGARRGGNPIRVS